jgi:hypothetical protein
MVFRKKKSDVKADVISKPSEVEVIDTKIAGRLHELVDRYEISISQMTMNLFPFTRFFFFLLSLTRLPLDFRYN